MGRNQVCVCFFSSVFDKLFMRSVFFCVFFHLACCSSVTSHSDSNLVGTPLNYVAGIQLLITK